MANEYHWAPTIHHTGNSSHHNHLLGFPLLLVKDKWKEQHSRSPAISGRDSSGTCESPNEEACLAVLRRNEHIGIPEFWAELIRANSNSPPQRFPATYVAHPSSLAPVHAPQRTSSTLDMRWWGLQSSYVTSSYVVERRSRSVCST